jgi:hypothetical protein
MVVSATVSGDVSGLGADLALQPARHGVRSKTIATNKINAGFVIDPPYKSGLTIKLDSAPDDPDLSGKRYLTPLCLMTIAGVGYWIILR